MGCSVATTTAAKIAISFAHSQRSEIPETGGRLKSPAGNSQSGTQSRSGLAVPVENINRRHFRRSERPLLDVETRRARPAILFGNLALSWLVSATESWSAPTGCGTTNLTLDRGARLITGLDIQNSEISVPESRDVTPFYGQFGAIA